MKLIFFDIDGVLTPTAHGIHLADMVGKGEELKKVFSGTTNRKIGLEWVVRVGARIFQGIPESVLEEAGETLPLIEGAEEVIAELKKAHYHPVVITNGIGQVAAVVARRVGIEEWYGNILEVEDGSVTGHLDTSSLITLQSKGDVVRKIVAQKSSREESVAVGNDENDWAMFQQVGFSILFCPSSNLRKRLKRCLENAEKGAKRDFLEFCQSVDVIIEDPNLRLLLPFLIPEPTIFSKKVKIEKTKFV